MTRDLSLRTIYVSIAAAVVVTVVWGAGLAGAAACLLLAVSR